MARCCNPNQPSFQLFLSPTAGLSMETAAYVVHNITIKMASSLHCCSRLGPLYTSVCTNHSPPLQNKKFNTRRRRETTWFSRPEELSERRARQGGGFVFKWHAGVETCLIQAHSGVFPSCGCVICSSPHLSQGVAGLECTPKLTNPVLDESSTANK